MTDFNKQSRIFVTCAKAMTPHLAGELKALGLPVTVEQEAGVETAGSLFDAMRMNLHLRTGHRVLYLLYEGRVTTADQLYAAARTIPWETMIAPNGYFTVTSAVMNDSIRDTRFPSLKCKDAIVDRIRDAAGQRPESGSETDRTVVFLYWQNDLVRIYIDTSGEPLSRRGYRKIPMAAPMQETLAAGVLLALGWDASCDLVNPMCGSGTLAIEAALIATNRAPALTRSNFGFMHLKGFGARGASSSPRDFWQAMREKAVAAIRPDVPCRIVANDINPAAVKAAMANAEGAGVADRIEFSVCDFRETPLPPTGGVVLLNPEYGERLGDEVELEGVYHDIGDFFKQRCLGRRGFVFTGNLNLAKRIGLRSCRRHIFFNSQLECRLLEFEMYEGSRRPGRQAIAEV